MQHDVFISHSHKDKALADAVCHYFEENKIKCWIAPRDITPGDQWANSIASAIPESKILLLLFSSHSNISEQVLREVELSVSNGLIIVPVRIEEIKPSGGMAYYLSTVHWIDMVDSEMDESLQSITTQVKTILKTGKKPQKIGNKPNPPAGPTSNKKAPVWLWFAIIFILLMASGSVYLFRDNIFGITETPVETEIIPSITTTYVASATTESNKIPTLTHTASPTPLTMATYHPDISSDTVIDIPDIALKSNILKTLNEQGHQVIGNITFADMLLLEELAIVSTDEETEFYLMYEGMEFEHVLTSDIGIQSIEGLQYAQNLKRLALSDQGITDISPLSQIHSLEAVILSNNMIADISALAPQSNLMALSISNNHVSDIKPLMLLIKLQWLNFSRNPVEDIDALSELHSLKLLQMNLIEITRLDEIQSLENLEYLSVSENQIKNFDDLQNLTMLREVECYNCVLKDISGLQDLPLLRHVGLEGNHDIVNLEILLELPGLDNVVLDSLMAYTNKELVSDLINKGINVDQQ